MKISKTRFNEWLDSLVADYELVAPVQDGKFINFKPVAGTGNIKTAYLNSKMPPKAVFFPQYEKMISYTIDGKNVSVSDHVDTTKRIIFGMRPCDAKSMLLLDKVFENDAYRDPYYCNRRDNTVIIGLGCQKPAATCFCSSLGLSPAGTEGSDILVIDLGEDYYLETVTEKGRALAATLPELSPLTAVEETRVADVKALTTGVDLSVDPGAIAEKLEGMFEHAFWDTLHEKCVSCNTCSFNCPTRHCFDMKEEVCGNEGCRVRTWDCCMSTLFTKHGSGHNPRDGKKSRWRQRLLHKFNYFLKNNGEISCVGCGRCVRNCPVNFDIRQAIDGVNKVEGVSQ